MAGFSILVFFNHNIFIEHHKSTLHTVCVFKRGVSFTNLLMLDVSGDARISLSQIKPGIDKLGRKKTGPTIELINDNRRIKINDFILSFLLF